MNFSFMSFQFDVPLESPMLTKFHTFSQNKTRGRCRLQKASSPKKVSELLPSEDLSTPSLQLFVCDDKTTHDVPPAMPSQDGTMSARSLSHSREDHLA